MLWKWLKTFEIFSILPNVFLTTLLLLQLMFTSCTTSPLRPETPATPVLCPTLPAAQRALRTSFYIFITWKSETVGSDYVPFASFTTVFLQSPLASWRPSSTWAATRMSRRRRLWLGACFQFTCVLPPVMVTRPGCLYHQNVKGELNMSVATIVTLLAWFVSDNLTGLLKLLLDILILKWEIYIYIKQKLLKGASPALS